MRMRSYRVVKTSDEFTEREPEVLRIMITGVSNAAIARKLNISESTVKNHIHIICWKKQAVRVERSLQLKHV